MFNLFKKKSIEVEIFAPCDGELLNLSEVPDAVFSQKMIGDGIAIIPESKSMYGVIQGKIVNIFPTNHAIGMTNDTGLEVLIHIGLDTVELKGEGFQRVASEGDQIDSNSELMRVDLEVIQKAGKEIVTPILITNMDKVEKIEYMGKQRVKRGDLMMKVTLKN